MKRQLILIFIANISLLIRVLGQDGDQKLLFYHFSEKDGLADNAVNCFYQDSRGVMWMGTENGLSCFDGSEFSNWYAEKTPGNRHLLANQINSITEDAHHTIWMATSNGLSSFNTQTRKIFTWLFKKDNYMYGLVCNDNKLWIASGDGLLLFDIETKKFRHFENTTPVPYPNLRQYNNKGNAVFLDSKKRLWLATINGLWLFDIKKETFEQYDGKSNDPFFDSQVNTIFEDHAGNIWIGTWNGGLKQVMPESHTIKNFNKVKGLPSHIMSIVEQHTPQNKYRLWLSDFLTEFDPETLQAQQHDLKPVAEAANLLPRCIYISKDSLLWISTVKGVYILDPSRQLFSNYFVGGADDITEQSSALFNFKGNLFVSGDKNFKLKLFDKNLKLVKDYTPAINALKNEYQKPGFAVMNIIKRAENELWLSSTAGVLKLNPNTGKFGIVCKTVTDSSNKSSAFINNLFINNNKIWCFPWRRGVWQFDEKLKKFTPLRIKLPDNGMPKNLNFQDAWSNKNGDAWITDLDYGLVKYTAATKTFARVVNTNIPRYSRVVNICYINRKLWLIANTNILAIDPLTQKITSWPMPNGMNKYIFDYTDDQDGNIWIASRTGLIVFNTSNYTFNQYTEEDGLVNNTMDGTIRALPGGDMVYAGENYLTRFNPVDLLRLPKKKDLVLTTILAGDTALTAVTTGNVSIPAGTEKVTFKWALINYTNPLQNRYYNKLEKIDNDWNYAGNKGKVEYNSLPPGDYKFRYRAVTADGLTGGEKVLLFTIEPTPWQTWWFRAAIFILIIACVLLINNDIRIKEQKKSALQLQLSNLEMKALRAQMNPHFIFNALNSIQECIITKNTTTAYRYLSSFSKLVRMILENSEKQFITLADETETLRLYLSIEKLRFDGAVNFQIKVDSLIEPSLISLPAMIVQPFVENALWHGLVRKVGDKNLSVSFKQSENNLICLVTDNGIGRALSNRLKTENQIKKNSMGIKITEERLQLLETGASISISDLTDVNGNANGTEVTIVMPLTF